MSENAKKKFSGWAVMIGLFLISFFMYAVISGTVSLFMSPICTEFGFETSEFSLLTTFSSIAMAVGAIWLAPRMQKGNIKMLMLISALVAGAGFAAMGFCQHLWQFFLVYGLANLGLAGIGPMPVALMITLWFQDRRSTAMSIALAGSSVGSAIWVQVFARLISGGNWRMCYYIGGAIIAVFGLVLIPLFVKKCPADYGQTAYIDANNKAPADSSAPAASKIDAWTGLNKKQAMKTTEFYLLAVLVFLIGCLAAGVATHSIYYLLGVGWELTKASAVLSLFSLMAIVSGLLGGVIVDKLGFKGGTLFSSLCAIVGLVALMLAKTPAFGYVFGAVFAFSTILPKLLPPMLTSSVFGTGDYGAIYSIVNVFFLGGCSLGAVLTGLVSKAAGYQGAWIMYIVFCVLIFLGTVVMLNGGKKLREKYPNPASQTAE